VKDYGIKLFVLDYLQLLDEDDPRGRQDRVQALRRISKRIVALKNKLNVPWLVLAQMNRNIETSEVKRAPVLSDLKECGAIEQDADVVMFLYPPLKVELEQKMPDGSETNHKDLIAEAMANAGITKRDDWPRRVNAAVAKNRYGPVGTVQMLFQSNRCRFHDWRDWATAKGVLNYGKGERENANPEASAEQTALISEEDVPK
jgi:replicative DNA helicase